eukprot:2333728-Amphidinium_carterae.1
MAKIYMMPTASTAVELTLRTAAIKLFTMMPSSGTRRKTRLIRSNRKSRKELKKRKSSLSSKFKAYA